MAATRNNNMSFSSQRRSSSSGAEGGSVGVSPMTRSPALTAKGSMSTSATSAQDSAPSASNSVVNFDALPIPPPPLSILLFRTPVSSSEGTDPYHDAFGNFCLPSFPMSALESGSSTPLPPPINPATLTGPSDRSGAEMLKSALSLSSTGRRRGRWIMDDPTLTTHHLSQKDPDEMDVLRDLTEKMGGNAATTSALLDDHVEYCVTSIPILASRNVNLEALAERMIKGASVDLPQFPEDQEDESTTPRGKFRQQTKYRGVIITSQRAAEAWEQAAMMAAHQLVQEASDRGDSHTTPPFTPWPRIPFFAVGPATANALKQAAQKLPAPFRPRLVLGGGATGTGEALANYVIKHFTDGGPGARPSGWTSTNGSPLNPPKRLGGVKQEETYRGPPPIEPLLLLTGDKNMPTIPDMLSSVGRPKREITGNVQKAKEAEEKAKAALATVTPVVQPPPPQDANGNAKRTWTPPKPPELHEMLPIPFEPLQVYETTEDPAFEEHLRSFEQTLPPASSRPSSRRPSTSGSEHDLLTNYAAATGITALASPALGASIPPPPTLLSAALAGAAREQEAAAAAAAPGASGTNSAPASAGMVATASNGSSTDPSLPNSASVTRRGSLKAKILAERLNAVNKAAAASGLPSPLQPTTPPAVDGAAPSASAGGTQSVPSYLSVTPLPQAGAANVVAPSPAATAHATAAFLQAASHRASGGNDSVNNAMNSKTGSTDVEMTPASAQSEQDATSSTKAGSRSGSFNSGGLSGKSINQAASGVLVSSPLAAEASTLGDDVAPQASLGAAAVSSNGGSSNGSVNGTHSSGAITPSGTAAAAAGATNFRAKSSGPSLAHESTLGTLDEDSALSDEALIEKVITMRQTKQANAHRPDWIVFFSPSGVQYALPHLRRRKWLPPDPPANSPVPPIDAKPGAGNKYPRVAVLGPTTKRWIRENLHFLPDAVAATPGAHELRDAINLVEKKRRMEKIKKQLDDGPNSSTAASRA